MIIAPPPVMRSGILLDNISWQTYETLLEVFQDQRGLRLTYVGSLTCRRQDLAKGLEPDQCYYIANEAIVRNLEQIDLDRDPPPDLVIEIDITSSSLDRMSLYLALGVLEVWCYDGERLQFYTLQEQSDQIVDYSPTFPFLSPNDILRFIEQRATIGETALIRSFRQWVRVQAQNE